MTAASPHTRFRRPTASDAAEPPEARGVPRDRVKLLVARPDGIDHVRFADLGHYLGAGDLMVVNNSATLPAAVPGHRDGRHRPDEQSVIVHFSTALTEYVWAVELRASVNSTGYMGDIRPGERIELPQGAALTVTSSYPAPGVAGSRLWVSRLAVEGDALSYLARNGRPIRYAYVPREWPLRDYQTVFARQPGSAEMPSAARPFTTELVTSLLASGIAIAPVTLHTGVSSAEPGEPPAPEWFRVSPVTARVVNMTKTAGGRVVAVGTTVTRALESAASGDGVVRAAEGWTNLVVGPAHPVRVVDGLITGWHEAGASHLLLLEAVAGPRLVAAAYREAARHDYLWHEFGDSALLLPANTHRRPAQWWSNTG
ncbi:MAG: S-adenosylmethionine:tRNA ribosyltransferase-isomerase [Mycobacteriaceae bacterium]|nr:S-adenosylmethionine:tRNA ribosyltransferase-isomerase [Mycobacteriaceae bacterium]MBV9640887.1 S-adenosylmethionine:tRNA ribosyltransferase-isomerase [Mycobacteriaceae bacterium]